MSTVLIVGNPKPRSRTWQAAEQVARLITGRQADRAYDLIDFGADLLDWSVPNIAAAVREAQQAELLVVASPTYKASYTGLLKLFLDRFAAGSLAGVTAVELMIGGDLRHSLAPEVFLKPVLAELGAASPTRGLFLPDAEHSDSAGWSDSPTLAAWYELARRQLPARLLAAAP